MQSDGRTAASAARDPDAGLVGFLAEIGGDAVSGKEHDAGETGRDHHVVALEGRRLAVSGEVRLEDDLGDAARFGPGGGRDFGAARSASSKVPTGGGPGRPVSLSGLHGLLDCTWPAAAGGLLQSRARR